MSLQLTPSSEEQLDNMNKVIVKTEIFKSLDIKTNLTINIVLFYKSFLNNSIANVSYYNSYWYGMPYRVKNTLIVVSK